MPSTSIFFGRKATLARTMSSSPCQAADLLLLALVARRPVAFARPALMLKLGTSRPWADHPWLCSSRPCRRLRMVLWLMGTLLRSQADALASLLPYPLSRGSREHFARSMPEGSERDSEALAAEGTRNMTEAPAAATMLVPCLMDSGGTSSLSMNAIGRTPLWCMGNVVATTSLTLSLLKIAALLCHSLMGQAAVLFPLGLALASRREALAFSLLGTRL